MATIEPLTYRLRGHFEVIEKGAAASNLGAIRGIVSSERMDLDGEEVDQDGIDWSYFLENGFLTYQHPLGVANIIGEPTKIERTELDGRAATAMEGVLYLHDDYGRVIYDKARTIAKAGTGRRLGLSIEGWSTAKTGTRVVSSKVISVAVDPAPKNPDGQFEPIAAALDAAFRMQAARMFRGASGIGYPTHAVPHAGELAPKVPQSIQGKPDTADRPAPSRLFAKLLEDLENEDLLAVRALKRRPSLTWTEAQALVIDSIRSTKE